MNRLQAHFCPVPPEPPLPTPSPRLSHSPDLHHPSNSRALHFTYGHVYAPVLFSQAIPPSPSLTESKSLLFVSPRCPAHQHPLSRVHIYVLIYDTGLPLSAFLHLMDIWPGLVPPFGCCAYGYADTVLLWRFLWK